VGSAVFKTVARRSNGSGGFDSHSLPSSDEDLHLTQKPEQITLVVAGGDRLGSECWIAKELSPFV
jgi:hypothetical protein